MSVTSTSELIEAMTISSPIQSWARMTDHFRSVRGPGFSRMASGIPNLPMSCSSVEISSEWHWLGERRPWAVARHSLATRWLCSAVAIWR